VRFAAELGRHTGTDFFLQRRELGLINIGGDALVQADGQTYEVNAREALYIGQGAKDLVFSSVDPARPAKLYFNSAPAHTPLPQRARSRWPRPAPRRWATPGPATAAPSTSSWCPTCCPPASC
jgi:5-keto 4-deoxyuronate isomerase